VAYRPCLIKVSVSFSAGDDTLFKYLISHGKDELTKTPNSRPIERIVGIASGIEVGSAEGEFVKVVEDVKRSIAVAAIASVQARVGFATADAG